MNPQKIFRYQKKWICDVCAVDRPEAEPFPWTAHPNFSCSECKRPTGAREVDGDLCGADGCDRREYYAGLCRGHYEQKTRGRDLRPLRKKGTSQISVRVSPETLAALGDNAAHRASEVLASWAKRSQR